jgi:RNA polymerase sigma-70 factor (ECF subfamily)
MTSDPHIKGLFQRIANHDDQEAYKELFYILQPGLNQFAFSILRSTEEAEDIVSDAFIRIWEKRKLLLNVESPRFYMFSAIKNLCLNRLKRNRRLNTFLTDEWSVQLTSIYADPEQMMISGEVIRRIQLAIEALPPRCRMIFKLIKEDGLRYKEVAELLSVSIKTVEAQMAIAMRKIAHCMPVDIKKASTPFRVTK